MRSEFALLRQADEANLEIIPVTAQTNSFQHLIRHKFGLARKQSDSIRSQTHLYRYYGGFDSDLCLGQLTNRTRKVSLNL